MHAPLSDEALGRLLTATTKCHEATSELGRRVEELGARVERHSKANREMVEDLRSELAAAQDAKLEAILKSVDDLAHDRTRGRTLLAAGRWITGLVLGFLVSGATYLYQESAAHATQLARHTDAIGAVRDTVERHERAPAHTGSQQRLSDLSGDVRALTVRIDELRSSVDRMTEQHDRPRRRDR